MIDLRKLRALVAVAETAHFGRAAERLGSSSPGLSRTVTALERELGVRLLRRTTRRVELTAAGAVFLDGAREVLARLERCVEDTRRAEQGTLGRLTIAYMDFAILGRLPELVAGFRAEHEDVEVELRYAWTLRQRNDLLDDRIDVGFMIGPFRAPGIRSLEVERQRIVAVLPAAHALARIRRLRLADLREQPFVIGDAQEWAPVRETIFRLCNGAGFAPRIVQEAHSRDGILGFVAAGLGITLYTSAVAAGLRPGLVVRPLEDVSETVSVIAAWRSAGASPPRERFVRRLRQALIGTVPTPG